MRRQHSQGRGSAGLGACSPRCRRSSRPAPWHGVDAACDREAGPPRAILCGLIGHYACCAGDTGSSWASSTSSASRLLTNPFRSVPPGTNGAVSDRRSSSCTQCMKVQMSMCVFFYTPSCAVLNTPRLHGRNVTHAWAQGITPSTNHLWWWSDVSLKSNRHVCVTGGRGFQVGMATAIAGVHLFHRLCVCVCLCF